MSDSKEEVAVEELSAEGKEKAKSEALTIAIGGSLAVAVVISYFGSSFVFLFAILLIGIHNHSSILGFVEKVPAFAVVVVVALVSLNLSGSDGGYSGYSTAGGVERVDGMTTGQLDGRDCTLVSLPGGQSMMDCD
ncbi:hypothetical protein D8Y20_10935 [Mariprofundus sp. EBB-1]|uniref:hypothetical protein n=1 Tax=Mariprofundus sp. EBB-1 TaxID=2650971 RepID=UPI000EF1D0CD|nr:hypothetical protein [Mariprofundus sp. EBB-1]RLL50792.1 hypothetical protein D8Y20_10935 [Mariprofundus sp. EBB-1]